MATLEIRPSTSPFNDGYIASVNASWATVRDGYSAGFSNTSNTTITIGTTFDGSVYQVLEAFLRFDLSDPVLTGASINSVTLEMRKSSGSQNGFIAQARIYDPGSTVTTADYRTAAQFGAATLVATLDFTSTLSNGVYSWTSEAAFVTEAQASIGGFLGLVICNNGFAAATAPTDGDSVNFNSANDATAANRPALIIDYTPAGGTEHVLAVSIAASSTLTSALERTAGYTAAIAASSTASGTFNNNLNFAASIPAISSITSEFDAIFDLTANINSLSSFSGVLNQDFSLSTTINAVSDLEAQFDFNTIVHEFAASIVASSGTTSSLSQIHSLETSILAASSVTQADLDIFKEYIVSLTMSSSVTSVLTRTAEFKAELNATGQLTPGLLALTKSFQASLTAHGDVNPQFTRPLRFNRNNTKVTPKAVVEFRA